MKKGKLLLNWQKEPIGVYLGDNNVFSFKIQSQCKLTNKQMLAFFYQENGLQGANLAGVKLYGANLSGARLHGADLRYAKLYNANLRGANLTCANLTCANLEGANLTGANLVGADLHRVLHNENTTWPEGFNKSRLSS